MRQLLESGYEVFVQAQNSFQLNGGSAILAVRPDLIIARGDHPLVIDGKTGQDNPSNVA